MHISGTEKKNRDHVQMVPTESLQKTWAFVIFHTNIDAHWLL